MAERAGQSDKVTGFRAAVEEETQAAEEIAALIERVTKTYLDLTLSGSKADS
ncbi:hypothetical protein LPC10_06565 [Methylorubrum sp. B1-46]|nr:hypothetical protein [Methylorubrum sp. B1-46]UGB28380.1 hypothetical protein LPC10_06565 [Methylorubrum sp. B1-46]